MESAQKRLARVTGASLLAGPYPALVAVLLITLIWRLPSLFDPPWVNDEGTYFAVAQSMAHGFRLYAQIWENKPPGLYILYSAVYHLFGASLLVVRIIAAATVLSTVVICYRLCRHYVNLEVAVGAALLAGLLFGVPFLEGTTGNAEIFISLFAALGVYLVIVRDSPTLGGLALACAILFKSVAAFDATALGLWLLLWHRPGVWRYVAAVTFGLILTVVLAAAAGILPSMLNDAIAYDLGYVGHGNGSGIPWLLVFKALVLVSLTVLLRSSPFPYLWLLFALTGAVVSGRFFGHYAIQLFVPFSLSTALVLRKVHALWWRGLMYLPAVFACVALGCAAVGWAMESSGHKSILASRLQWYANFLRMSAHAESYATYRSQIDDHVVRNIQVAEVLSGMPPGRILVWGNAPWVYVLSHRLPATPYTSALRSPEVPGETGALRRSVSDQTAREVVVVWPDTPKLAEARNALTRNYRPVETISNATIYVAVDSTRRRRESASATPSASSGTR